MLRFVARHWPLVDASGRVERHRRLNRGAVLSVSFPVFHHALVAAVLLRQADPTLESDPVAARFVGTLHYRYCERPDSR